MWSDGATLGQFRLTWNMNSSDKRTVRVSTIHAFKGLESPVIILTELDAVYKDTLDQLLYIGISRARNHLVIIGELPAPNTRITS
ncbi:MAG: ATP-binding domain-containing protein [Blastochloris sp.]|nr:ATP-binding domain-containing protein [Blastochloris sp.]